MSALGRVVRGGVGRRRVQTVVVGLSAAMAVTAAVLGGSLLVASSAPFDTAFAAQRGAHLTARFDGDKVTAAQLAASATATGVTAAAGPFPTASLVPGRGDQSLPPMTVVGRAAPDGPVDAVTLTRGSWVTAPGQIVLAAGDGPMTRLGSTLTFPDLPGAPTLTVVGFARSVSRTADAWVTPTQLAPVNYQMLYRFAAAGTVAEVAAGRAAVAASVPDGALAGAQSWLTVKDEAVRTIALFVPFLTAFGVLGLVMSVLIVGNVVAGSVGAALRRIGILKALGFTPGQVVRAYLAQALIPASVGIAVGVVAGHLLSIPVLAQTEAVYGAAKLTVAPWLDAAVVAGTLGIVALAAWAGALRAGRLSTVDAIAVGRVPSAGRGRWATRVTARLPLPRPVSLGLARPFARPARALAMTGAIAFGAVAVTFAVGLSMSLHQVEVVRDHNGDVIVDRHPPEGQPPAAPGTGPSGEQGPGTGPGPAGRGPAPDPAAVVAAIEAQPDTLAYYGVATTEVTVAGLTGTTTALAFTGDGSSFYRMTEGRWFAGPGEAVAPTPFLAATGARIGDTITVDVDATPVTVRIVGEVFDTHNQGREILTAAGTFAAAAPDLRPDRFHIGLRPGADPAGYAGTLSTAVASLGLSAYEAPPDEVEVTIAINTLTTMLTVMLVSVAALGVFNAVVLDTRDRVRDLGIHKALGMMPRQTIAMVLSSVVVVGVVGGIVGAPAGAAVHGLVMPAMGDAVGLNLPPVVTDIYEPLLLILLGLCGLVIAVVGALLPAGWAARTRTVTALRTE
jgi:putative ABC transport system permease protein